MAVLRALLLGAAVIINEASAMTMTEMMGAILKKRLSKSKEDIMHSMTLEEAARVVMELQKTKEAPELMSLIEKHVANRTKGRHRRSALLRGHSAASQTPAPTGYAALTPATNLLNDMMAEASMTLDLSIIQCDRFERKQMLLLQEAQSDVASFNGLAAEARGCVLKSQATIGSLSMKIPEVRAELEQHRKTCERQRIALKNDLAILDGDLAVMDSILSMTNCPTSTPAPSFVQVNIDALMHCPFCGPMGTMLVQQAGKLRPMVNALKSKAAREFMHTNLLSAFNEAPGDGAAVTQEMVSLFQAQAVQEGEDSDAESDKDSDADAPSYPSTMTGGAGDLNVADVPVNPAPVDCHPTDKCTLKPGSCLILYERFTNVKGGIADKRDATADELVNLERFAEETDASLSGQINSLGDQLRETQTNLAMCTKQQIDAEAQSHAKGRQHSDLKAEYTQTLEQCCAAQNDEKSEICALTKIRGELYNLKGLSRFIIDCEVSDWSEGECSATCGGGFRKKTRKIVMPPDGGMACPPLELGEECNDQPCPVDCKLADWSGWSACTADCGGGVRERTRRILVEPVHGGEACADTEEEEVCNVQACDRDCVLSEWSAWETCNKACGGGNQRRIKTIAAPAMGAGTCPVENDRSRMAFQPCNTFSCTSILPANRTTLNCQSRLDVVIVLDSSGSLGQSGWDQSKALTKKLVTSLNAVNASNVKIALLVFSHPTFTAWATHLSSSTTANEVETKATWHMMSTHTAEALNLANEEFLYGRDDAASVVICITDGWPYSQSQTKEAALKLQKTARVMWVPIGPNAPVDLINEMASLPVADHVVRVQSLKDVGKDDVVNKVIAGVCPQVA